MIVELRSSDLLIRTIEPQDLPFRVDCINDPGLAETLSFDLPITLESTRDWFNRVRDRGDRVDATVFVSAEPVGFCGLLSIDFRVRKAEVYCFIGRQFQGRGIGTRVYRCLQGHAFEELGLQRLYAYTLTHNQAQLRMLNKLGWQMEGTLRRDVLHEHECVDRYVLSLLHDDPGAQRPNDGRVE